MLLAIPESGKRIPKMMRWGLLTHWAKDEKLSYSHDERFPVSARPTLK
jgi:hypothetical protein